MKKNFEYSGIKVGERIDKIVGSWLKSRTDITVNGVELLPRTVAADVAEIFFDINEEGVKKSYRIRESDKISVDVEAVEKYVIGKVLEPDLEGIIEPEVGTLNIIFEDANYVIIDKPRGLVVHPGHNNKNGTLANYFKGYLTEKGEYDNQLERAGIVHRLDKGVGGLILLAKNRKAQLYYKSLFEKHAVLKLYEANVKRIGSTHSVDISKVPEGGERDKQLLIDGLVESYVNGAEPSDEWMKVEGYISRDKVHRKRMQFNKVPGSKKRYSLSFVTALRHDKFLINIKTGRTHQIRATLRYLGYQINGDTLYFGNGKTQSERIELRSIFMMFKDQDSKEVTYSIE